MMNAAPNIHNSSTLGELTEFLSAISSKAVSGIRQYSGQSSRLAVHLERQLPKEQAPVIFRRLGKHTQLVLQFGN